MSFFVFTSNLQVRDTPVDAQLLPSVEAQSNPRYRPMLSDVRTRVGFSSSVSCADHMPNGGAQVIPGDATVMGEVFIPF